MAKPRDYAVEYARRVERGIAKGLSRTQARGHPRQTEKPVSRKVERPRYDRRLEEGLKTIRSGKPLNEAAKTIHVAPERLRSYIQQTGVVEKKGKQWTIGTDSRLREMPLFSEGQAKTVTVADYQTAYEIGRFMSAVGQFLNTNDVSVLQEFVGKSIVDVDNIHHIFETRPNTLYRLSLTGDEPYEQVYRIVA